MVASAGTNGGKPTVPKANSGGIDTLVVLPIVTFLTISLRHTNGTSILS
jgi:hypothetical protein